MPELDIVEQVKAEIASRNAAVEETPEPEYAAVAPVKSEEPSATPTPDPVPTPAPATNPPPASPPVVAPAAPAVVAGGDDDEPDLSWIDDDTKAVAALLGIPEGALAECDDRADFDRITRIAALANARPAPVPGTGESGAAVTVPPATPPAAPPPPKQDPPPAAAAKSMVEELKEAGYDDPVILKMGERLDKQNEALARQEAADQARQQQHAQAQQREVLTAAHSSLDSLDAGRYGKAFDEQGRPALQLLSKEAQEARIRTLNMAEALFQAAVREKRPLPSIPVLLKLADNAAFAAENVAKAKAAGEQGVIDKVRSQSRRRLGGSARPGPVPTPFKGPISENPDMVAAVREIINNPA